VTPLLVSLHLPKTAGTSFAAALAAAFPERFHAEYVDQPMQYPAWRRRLRAVRLGVAGDVARDAGIDCVHGHFLALKYRLGARGRPLRFITWLREPVERLASHYHFWRRDYDGQDPSQPLRNRMLAEDWSFERFALGPEMRNVYRQYLWGVDPRSFAFIGITEHYEAHLGALAARYLGGEAPVASALVNPARGGDRYDVPAGLRARILAHHAADAALYGWAAARPDPFGDAAIPPFAEVRPLHP
jgi:hypothetical protein